MFSDDNTRVPSKARNEALCGLVFRQKVKLVKTHKRVADILLDNHLVEDDPQHLTGKVTEIDQHIVANTQGMANIPTNITASLNQAKGQIAADIGAHLANRLTTIPIPPLSMATPSNEGRRTTHLRNTSQAV
jgi:hypothetical protein